MKAVVIEKQGSVDNLAYREWPDPEVRPGDVLIKVKAVGLNHLDVFVRRGMPGFPVPMPFISGGASTWRGASSGKLSQPRAASRTRASGLVLSR